MGQKETGGHVARKKVAKVDLKERLARALADYDNLEKRVAQQRKEWAILARLEVFDKLLPLFDDLDRAQNHLKDRGLAVVLNQFQSLLKSEGVEEIETGERVKFDPQLMDCVGLVAGPKNKIVNVLTKGYRLGTKVIRPASVEVGAGQQNKK